MRLDLMYELKNCHSKEDLLDEKKHIDDCLDRGFIDEVDYEILIRYYYKLLDR